MATLLPPFLVPYVEGRDEDDRVEMKLLIDLNDENNERKKKFVKTVCALANTSDSDAFVLLGVKDRKSILSNESLCVGFPVSNFESFKQQVTDAVRNFCINGPRVNVAEHEYDGKNVVVIRIQSSGFKPFRTVENKNIVWIRAGEQTREANPDELIRMVERPLASKARYDAAKEAFNNMRHHFEARVLGISELVWMIEAVKEYVERYASDVHEGYHLLFCMYRSVGNYEEAIEYLTRAVEMSGVHRYRLDRLAMLLEISENLLSNTKDSVLGVSGASINQISQYLSTIGDDIGYVAGFSRDTPELRRHRRRLDTLQHEITRAKAYEEESYAYR